MLRWTEGYFAARGIATPRLDAELLLARTLGVGRLDLYTGYRRPLDPDERARFRGLLLRRARREPIAHILGEREFYSLAFTVTPAVLVPRPETEHVVDAALELLAAGPPAPRALDLGTGSGNIAVTLAVHAPALEVVAVDIDPGALAVAGENCRRHGVESRVHLARGDLFAAVASGSVFDLIVSNPPYVRADELPSLMPEVRIHEPRTALVDLKSPQSDGLGHYRAIAASAGAHLAATGAIVVEVGESQAADVERIFAASGFAGARRILDHAGIARVVVARRRDESI